MRCNWLLALQGHVRGKKIEKREFAGCFATQKAAQNKADMLNNPYCGSPQYRGICWTPVFNPPPGVTLRGHRGKR